jgi:hypothetical protein
MGATISILTPLGIAALGLRVGSKMPYVTRDGARLTLSVERIAYQPESESGRTIVALRRRPSQAAPDDDDPGPNQAA